MHQPKIRINEIFPSIDGEVNAWGMGGWSIFIRFQGCSASCSFCDTPQARSLSGELGLYEEYTSKEIIKKIRKFKIGKVTITGGEPMEQFEGLVDLVVELESWNYDISIETNGYHPLQLFKTRFPDVGLVADFKMENMPSYLHFKGLKQNDYVKFLVGNWEQLRKVSHFSKFLLNVGSPKLAISAIKSPSFNENVITNYIKTNGLYHLQLNTQLHKLLDIQ